MSILISYSQMCGKMITYKGDENISWSYVFVVLYEAENIWLLCFHGFIWGYLLARFQYETGEQSHEKSTQASYSNSFPNSTHVSLPDSTKPLPRPMLTYYQWCSVAFTSEQFHEYSWIESIICVSEPQLSSQHLVNTLKPRQDGLHFADDIFKCIFLNEDKRMSFNISLKFVPKDPVNNIAALVQIMAWCHPGDKPLSEPMMVSLPTHICVTRPQWVKMM